jgi:RND family efflux transporter MFP subunit
VTGLLRKRAIMAATLALVITIVILATRRSAPETPTASVQRGTFIVSLTETGELRATRSATVTSPRVGNWSDRPQVVKLAPEGSTVKKGDFLAQFDTSALDKTIEQKQSELEIAQADLSRALAANVSLMEDLQANLANVKAAYELAELQLEQMQYEAEVKQREQQLQLERSRNDVTKAETKLTSQRTINAEDEKKLQLRVSQATAQLETAQRERGSLTLLAPNEGLVVYPKVWSGGEQPKKVQEGDTPWPGQPIIELPALNEMEVITEVSEVDVAKVKEGQRVEVRLDAFPESLFTGAVRSVATLAREKSGDNPVKVFEVSVLVETPSPILRPGMTASSTIIIDEIPDTLWIPIDAVYRSADTTVAYTVKGGRSVMTPIRLGPKNDNHVVVAGGLTVGQAVSLVEPGAADARLTTEPKDSASRAGGERPRSDRAPRVRGRG